MKIDHKAFTALLAASLSERNEVDPDVADLVIEFVEDYSWEVCWRVINPRCIPTIKELLTLSLPPVDEDETVFDVPLDPIPVTAANEHRWRELARLEESGQQLNLTKEERDILHSRRRGWVGKLIEAGYGDYGDIGECSSALDFSLHPMYVTVELLDQETNEVITVDAIRELDFLAPTYDVVFSVSRDWITSLSDLGPDGRWLREAQSTAQSKGA